MKARKKNSSNAFGVCVGEALPPLMEGPIPESQDEDGKNDHSWLRMKSWMKSGKKRSDPRLLLGVLGCPLAPVGVCSEPFPHLSIKDIPIV